jgi:hypothetical protein
MDSKIQHGYLVLADISGFTSYLATTELDHAHEILSELLELIVNRFSPVLTLSKLEGDAVFAYAPESKLSRGETFFELLETTYVAFKDRATSMQRRTTCECKACRAISTLDLKFFAHHGDYIFQNVAGRSEVVGSDVNLVHRLLKNHVSETTGWHAYALFSEQCLQHVGVHPEGLHAQAETYEHLGEIQTYSLDLKSRYKEISEARRAFITPEEADLVLTYDFPVPPPIIWDWLNDPYKRSLVAPENHWTAQGRPGGRTGAGAQNHCAHGKGGMIETILDWRPFDYCTVHMSDPDMGLAGIQTSQYEPIPGGTRLHCHFKFEASWPRRLMFKLMFPRFMKPTWERTARMIAEEQTAPAHNVVLSYEF